jgi:predicted metal-dependent phosphoesterase TrpH/energy-coupling factor transporter ATP-binding protein EcfA2
MSDVLKKAETLPEGARFHRCALQVNPPSYSKNFRGKDHGLTDAEYITKIFEKCDELGIRAIAVTDHNDAGAIGMFRALGQKHKVVVFPGFEVASQEGVHVLCIFGPDSTESELHRFLGQLDITSTDPSSSLSKKTLSEILECVREQGGLTIAAHVTQENGLLFVLHGQARINAWRDPNLLAVQIPGSTDDAPDDKRPILKNKNDAYSRAVAPGSEHPLAILNAKDIVVPSDLEDPSSSCWIKMSEFTIEGLRQAFLDPSSRVRLASDPVPGEHAEFLLMAWEGGFLDGSATRFNENLNVLIGGRGTGKSTVVESLRCVLGLEPLGKEAKQAHEGFLKQVLKSGTRIVLSLRVHRPSVREFTVERTLPNPPVVKDENGKVLTVSPIDIVPSVQVFGQHEISELAKDPQQLTHLLDRFILLDEALLSRKSDLARKLRASRIDIKVASETVAEHDEQLAALPKLEETLKRFQDAGLEEKLKDNSLLVHEEQILKTMEGRLTAVRTAMALLSRSETIDKTFLDALSREHLPAEQTFHPFRQVLTNVESAVAKATKELDQSLKAAEATVDGIRGEWTVRKGKVESDVQKTLRDLQRSSKEDGAEFIKLRKQIETLRPLAEQRKAALNQLAESEGSRRSLVVAWETAKAEAFRAVERAAKKVTKRLEGRVRVTVTDGAARDGLLVLLKDRLGGRLSEALESLRTRENLSLRDLAETARLGKDTLIAKYGLVAAQAERMAQAAKTDPALWMEVEELELPATTKIELNVGVVGESDVWQELADLSTGQKATAVLLLLLLDSDAPLVVDQPEDDLDNRFITDSIVPRMRDEKRRRQFVFATHNANIPALGDAEQIIGLTARGDASRGRGGLSQKHMGSIDTPVVRELVEELLEGGRRAFEQRRRKYGF